MSRSVLRRFIFGVSAILALTTTLVAAFPARQASANSGEAYTWSSNTEISVSGGVLSGAQSLTAGGANMSGFGGTLTHQSGCQFKVTLMISTPNNGIVSFPQVAGGNPIPNQCKGDLIQSFTGPVTIQGTRPAPGGTAETAGQRTVSVTVNSPDTSEDSPDDVTAKLTDSSGKELKTITMAKDDSADSNEDPTQRVVGYKGNFTDIDPGNYKVCLNSIDTTCKSFTKAKYQPASVEFGENLANRSIVTTVELHWTGPPEQRTVGPVTLVLKKNGTEVAHADTDTQDYIPTDEQSQVDGSITVSFVFDLHGTLTNVDEGSYQLCVSGTSVCKDVKKEKDLKLQTTIVIDGQDAANIILGSSDDEEHPVCQSSSSALSWLICPIVNGLGEFTDWIELNIIVPFMRPSPVGLDPNDKATGAVYQIWSDMRVYADIILVVLLLVAVISQAYGGGIVEVYTAKKMLPRILVAAILINTSIYIVAFAIDMSNLIGAGIADIITTPLVQTGNFTFSPNNIQAFAVTGIAVAIGALTTFLVSSGLLLAILPFLLLFLVLPAFLAIVAIFVILAFLQGLYMALTIFSPIAFALYAFPNTEKYFHRWWDWLFRALLVYPFYMTILAVSDVFSVLIQKANGG